MGIRYSFDLGSNSIGFAVWRTGPAGHPDFGPDAPLELLWSGVRLFKDGRNPKDQQSLATMRRIPKQARKRRDRFVLRRADLMKALVEAGLMPAEASERKALEALDPYELRAARARPRLGAVSRWAASSSTSTSGEVSNRIARPIRATRTRARSPSPLPSFKDALREHNCRTLRRIPVDAPSRRIARPAPRSRPRPPIDAHPSRGRRRQGAL